MLCCKTKQERCCNVGALPAEKGKNASLFTKLPSTSRKWFGSNLQGVAQWSLSYTTECRFGSTSVPCNKQRWYFLCICSSLAPLSIRRYAILCLQPGAWTQLALLLCASRLNKPFYVLFCHKVLHVGSGLEHSALFHIYDVLPCTLCAKPGFGGADVLDIVNMNCPKLGDVCTPYLFNVKAQQGCIPHTQSRDPHRSDVAVPQSLVNHSICIGQSFAVFVADDVGRFQNSLYFSLNSFCRAITILQLLFSLCFQPQGRGGKKETVLLWDASVCVLTSVLVSVDWENAYSQSTGWSLWGWYGSVFLKLSCSEGYKSSGCICNHDLS